jgi:hypothetical protein
MPASKEAAAAARATGKEVEPLADEATRLLRAEMVRRGFTFKRLADAMAVRDGESESVQTLINKVNRGRFSFAFFIRVCRAMEIQSIDIAPVEHVDRESN